MVVRVKTSNNRPQERRTDGRLEKKRRATAAGAPCAALPLEVPTKEAHTQADLNAVIKALDLAKTSSVLPAKAVVGSVADLLTTIRVFFLLFRNDPPQAYT
jgi:hypothetical protein